MSYYLVECKCGHLGRYKQINITFPIEAENGIVASYEARMMPRVKRDHKDAVISCKKATYEEYLNQLYINENDPYLKCSSKQEQNRIYEFIDNRVIVDEYNLNRKKKIINSRRPNLIYQKQKYNYMYD